MEEEIIGIQNLDTGIGNAGVGFVVVPTDIDREQYINNCYRTNTLTINGGEGYGYFRGVHADIDVMQNITFPDDDENRGTAVVWVKDSISQLPVIVGVLRKQNEYYSLSENQYRLKRNNIDKTRVVEIFIDGDTSSLDINIVGDKHEPANVNIKLSSENNDSVFNLSCDNEINVSSDKNINIESNQKISIQISDKGEIKSTISYELGTGLIYKDEFENEVKCKDGEIDIISNKINHNSGKEPMVLGNTFVDLMKQLINAINSITVPIPQGISGTPLNYSVFNKISSDLEKTLSKISNLD
jgi:hypothetical protein